MVPYAIVLAIAAGLYYFAQKIDFVAPGGRIGPAVWPKTILLLAMAACAYEIIKNLFFSKEDHELKGVLESIIDETPAEDSPDAPEARSYPHLLIAGIGMTVAYVMLIGILGFFVSTVLYLAGFMLVGRYRRIGVVLATSLIGSLVFMFVFMKVVYVSLPLGQEPFAQVTYLLMRLMGIK
jgi:putative tricarboxylic transport membrane protein